MIARALLRGFFKYAEDTAASSNHEMEKELEASDTFRSLEASHWLTAAMEGGDNKRGLWKDPTSKLQAGDGG